MKQNLWCCVKKYKKTFYDFSTLAETKKRSIKYFEGEGIFKWQDFKDNGWKCIKVEVEIKPINEVK
jgi:hypothetical protein